MPDPVIILAPPRSYTSIVCSMLGQHPQLYGLPEVHLFVAETMEEREEALDGPARSFLSHGLLRAVAELVGGEQTVPTVALAHRWLSVRAAATCHSVFRELAQRTEPRAVVDKSVTTVTSVEYLYRCRRAFPNVRFIHLVRHPRPQGISLWKLWQDVRQAIGRPANRASADFQKVWYTAHVNISTFLAGVDGSQWVRVKGEDVLKDPESQLQGLSGWLGLRTDAAALESMLHPERSPFACFGPPGARFGNDPNFMAAPALRRSTERAAPSLDGPLEWREDGAGFSEEVRELAERFGYA